MRDEFSTRAAFILYDRLISIARKQAKEIEKHASTFDDWIMLSKFLLESESNAYLYACQIDLMFGDQNEKVLH